MQTNLPRRVHPSLYLPKAVFSRASIDLIKSNKKKLELENESSPAQRPLKIPKQAEPGDEKKRGKRDLSRGQKVNHREGSGARVKRSGRENLDAWESGGRRKGARLAPAFSPRQVYIVVVVVVPTNTMTTSTESLDTVSPRNLG